jgi:hypothetical protein
MNLFLRVWGRWLIPLVVIALAVAVVALNLRYVEAAPARSDFVARWEGAHAWVADQTSPYDPRVSLAAQERVYGRAANVLRGEDPQHFLYPFPALLIYGPFGLLDFEPAEALWISLIEAALLISTLIWAACVRWRWSPWLMVATLIFSVAWYPAFAAIVGAQFAAVEALLMAAALAAVRAQRQALTGLLLAACLFKPQLGLAFVVYVTVWAVASRRSTLLGWLLTGLVALTGISLLLDPGWPAGMARQWIEYLAHPVSASPLMQLAQALGAGTIGAVALSGVCLIYLTWEWKDSLPGDGPRFLWTVSMTQAVALLVMPFGIAANLVTAMLPLIVILEAWQARQGRAIDAPASVILLLLGVFTWAVARNGLDGELPSLWLTVGVPLLLMVGLFWVRWWTTRARAWADLGERLT